MVKGIYSLAQSDYNLPLNIGNPSEMSILDLAENIKKLIKSESKIVFHNLPVDDPIVRRPDITKAKEILDWEPEVVFKDGVKKTIKWFTREYKL